MVAAVESSYREALDLQGDGEGLDEQWYGFTVYKLIGPQLGRRLARVPDVKVERRAGAYELFIGRNHVRYNKLRGAAGRGLYAYPRPSRAAQLMADLNQAQLELPLGADGVPVTLRPIAHVNESVPTEWILGHLGSSSAGLSSVYLCAPATAIDGEITAWQTWTPIYYHGAAMPDSVSVPAPSLPEPIDIGEPVLRVRPTSARGAGHQNSE